MDALQYYREKLRSFAEQVPQLLSRHPETLEEARIIREQLAVLDISKHFRLAVTGKIKQGKSTLVNALVGRSLPTVGVNETTATLNFISYGTGDDLQRIRVRWKDKTLPETEYPLEFLSQLQGADGKTLAERIEGVFLFSDADFLKDVQLIDSPGELGTRLNEIDVKADALIRVLPYVSEANDQTRLGKFGAETRPFGSAAYNTIGVIQMWESHWLNGVSGDPFSVHPLEKAVVHANEQLSLLGDAVSELIPVSGLLELFAISKDTEDDCLNDILEFTKSTSKDDVIKMLKHYDFFQKREYKTSSIEFRQRIWSSLSKSLGFHAEAVWPMLKMAIFAAHYYSPSNPQKLRACLHTMSNIDRLNDILRKRFFAISELIQTGSQLNKVIIPCDFALHRLRVNREKKQNLIIEGEECLKTLEALPTQNAASKQEIKDYLQKMREVPEKEVEWIKETCLQVSNLKSTIESDFALIQQEVACLHALDGKGDSPQLKEVRHILGQSGIEMYQRLECDPATPHHVMKEKAWSLYKKWKIERGILPYGIQESVIGRLDSILNVLTMEDTKNRAE